MRTLNKSLPYKPKKLRVTYSKAEGRVFTHSPDKQIFTDENGNSDYDYSAMTWLLHNGYLVKKKIDFSKTYVTLYHLNNATA